MADGINSPLPFPSPRTILGEDTSPPVVPPPTTAEQPARRPKHARSPSKKDNVKKAVLKKGAAADADAGPDAVKGAKVDKPKQTKSRNGNC